MRCEYGGVADAVSVKIEAVEADPFEQSVQMRK